VIETLPFGRTGHASTRILFGAAALGGMSQAKADSVLELLLEYGINHIDTASAYGDSELRIGPWMREHRERFFLATKTRERSAQGARESLHRSLERLRVDHVDLIQLHNLVDDEGWQQAFADDGAVAALTEARDQGLVRFLGVTGHGTQAAAMHHRSLGRFPFDSVLLPYNYTMLEQPAYARDFEALVAACEKDSVAIQTIKSVARRRWQDDSARRFSWYEPLRDAEAVTRAVRFVLARPGIFLNSSSDATLLRLTLEAASQTATAPDAEALAADVARFEMQPLFVPGADTI
jgi:aryl-alcohol dehydrogenase-like predicted oxidoreductase